MSRIITRFAKRNRERRGADGEEKNASYTRERYIISAVTFFFLVYFYGFSTRAIRRKYKV